MSELFVEGGALDGHIAIAVLTEHEFVLFYEIFLEHFDHLDRHHQGDGYHGVEKDKVGEKIDEAIEGNAVFRPINIYILFLIFITVYPVQNGTDEAQHDLNTQNNP